MASIATTSGTVTAQIYKKVVSGIFVIVMTASLHGSQGDGDKELKLFLQEGFKLDQCFDSEDSECQKNVVEAQKRLIEEKVSLEDDRRLIVQLIASYHFYKKGLFFVTQEIKPTILWHNTRVILWSNQTLILPKVYADLIAGADSDFKFIEQIYEHKLTLSGEVFSKRYPNNYIKGYDCTQAICTEKYDCDPAIIEFESTVSSSQKLEPKIVPENRATLERKVAATFRAYKKGRETCCHFSNDTYKVLADTVTDHEEFIDAICDDKNTNITANRLQKIVIERETKQVPTKPHEISTIQVRDVNQFIRVLEGKKGLGLINDAEEKNIKELYAQYHAYKAGDGGKKYSDFAVDGSGVNFHEVTKVALQLKGVDPGKELSEEYKVYAHESKDSVDFLEKVFKKQNNEHLSPRIAFLKEDIIAPSGTQPALPNMTITAPSDAIPTSTITPIAPGIATLVASLDTVKESSIKKEIKHEVPKIKSQTAASVNAWLHRVMCSIWHRIGYNFSLMIRSFLGFFRVS